MDKLCNFSGCEAAAGYVVSEKDYCRKHYIIVIRKAADHDQRVFTLANVKQQLLHGPHAGASITARLSKVDRVFWLSLTHESNKGASKTITFRNLSKTDLRSLALFFSSIAREMGDASE